MEPQSAKTHRLSPITSRPAIASGQVVSSGWVNYVTGAYSVTFATAPASNATIVAKWTNIMSSNSSSGNEQTRLGGRHVGDERGASIGCGEDRRRQRLSQRPAVRRRLAGWHAWGSTSTQLFLRHQNGRDTRRHDRATNAHHRPVARHGHTGGRWAISPSPAIWNAKQYDEDAGRNSVFSATIGGASGIWAVDGCR